MYSGVEWYWQIAIGFATAFIGWFFGKLQTKRENKKTDLEIINGAITPLLESIAKLTEQVSKATADLLAKDERIRNMTNERTELLDKINKLEKEVKRLTDMVQKMTKK